MVKKFVLLISNESDEEYSSVDVLLKHNQHLQKTLTKYKNKITEYYKNKLWDRYKKLTNEYEMIFTTPNNGTNVSSYNPVSRSFFKMWELIHDFSKDLKIDRTEKINAIFLAEGPGGFAEAFVKYRSNTIDNYYGISLKSVNKNIPDWKYQNKVKICYGADDTGDLYNIMNLNYLSKNHPKMDIITADGGFDFSNDFNAQENSSIQLILCEIYTALIMQEVGGSFILKIYDIFNEYTLKLITLLKLFYDNIYIVKPLSSRPANSEKYLVCTGFKNNDEALVSSLAELISDYTNKNVSKFFNLISYDNKVLHNLISYNIYYTFRQIYYIEQTIMYINKFGKSFHDENIKDEIKKIMDHHREKSVKWCKKYNIEYY